MNWNREDMPRTCDIPKSVWIVLPGNLYENIDTPHTEESMLPKYSQIHIGNVSGKKNRIQMWRNMTSDIVKFTLHAQVLIFRNSHILNEQQPQRQNRFVIWKIGWKSQEMIWKKRMNEQHWHVRIYRFGRNNNNSYCILTNISGSISFLCSCIDSHSYETNTHMCL